MEFTVLLKHESFHFLKVSSWSCFEKYKAFGPISSYETLYKCIILRSLSVSVSHKSLQQYFLRVLIKTVATASRRTTTRHFALSALSVPYILPPVLGTFRLLPMLVLLPGKWQQQDSGIFAAVSMPPHLLCAAALTSSFDLLKYYQSSCGYLYSRGLGMHLNVNSLSDRIWVLSLATIPEQSYVWRVTRRLFRNSSPWINGKH